jgi:multidrug efflux pump subunit AcrA (membrane-fusion protein)
VLERLRVREGQRVQAGDVLAEFRSIDLENQREGALAEHEIQVVRCQALREQSTITSDVKQRARISADLGTATGERTRSAHQVELLDGQLRRLEVRAPRAGVVIGLPRADAIGKLWEKHAAPPLCTVGDPGQLWVEVPLGPADYRLLRDELSVPATSVNQRSSASAALPISIRECGRQGPTWSGTIARLPESEAKEIPLGLAQPAGGPVAVKPGGGRTPAPQSQQYLVAVAVENPDGAVAPGCLAQVSVHCRWRSAAWWVWRGLTSAFDLRLY